MPAARRRRVDHLRDHLDHLRGARYSDATIRERARVIDTLPADRMNLDRAAVRRWWARRQKTADGELRAPAGLAAEASHVRSFYRWAIAEDLTDVNPGDWLPRVRTPVVKARPIPVADFQRALLTARTLGDQRMVRMLALAGLAGLRVAEIGAVTWDDIDQHSGELWIRRGKGSKDRSVPVSQELLELLGDPPEQGGHIIGMPMLGKSVSHVVNTFLHGLGISSTAHKLRARYLTEVQAKGGDLAVTAELAGHASVSTTQRYVTPSAERKRQAGLAAGALGRLPAEDADDAADRPDDDGTAGVRVPA